MAQVDGGRIICRVFKQEGVKDIHGIIGGHVVPITQGAAAEGLRLVGYRDERGAAHAAEAYSRMTKKPAVAMVTAGVGVTNATTGVASAMADNIPLVVFGGRHSRIDEGRGALQEMEGTLMFESITKWCRCIHEPIYMGFFAQQAFREAVAPSPGPVLIESCYDVLATPIEEESIKVLPPHRYKSYSRPMGDPDYIERAVDMFLKAEKPLIMAGDSIYWSEAAPELREFVELLQVPVYTTKLGEGSYDEKGPLAVHRVMRSKFTRVSDVAMAIGVRFWRGEGYGDAPSIYNPDINWIQVDPDAKRIGYNITPEIGIVGDPKMVLRQMIDCAKERIKEPRPKDTPWLNYFREQRQAYEDAKERDVKKVWDNKIIHPDRLTYEVVNWANDDAIFVLDGMHTAAFAERFIQARNYGQVIPLNNHGAQGPGVPWSVGAQLAQPNRQVICFEGDGSFGLGGFELETAARYELPIIVVVYNNNAWAGGAARMAQVPGDTKWAYMFQPNLRYDKLAEALGCRGEYIEDAKDIIPALERAKASGRPTLLNVMTDPGAASPIYGGGTGGERKMKERFW